MAKHISSDAIQSIIEYLENNTLDGLNGIESIKNQMENTNITFPDFGVVGYLINVAYNQAREEMSNTLDNIHDTINDYIAELQQAKDAWIAAEDANTIVVVE